MTQKQQIKQFINKNYRGRIEAIAGAGKTHFILNHLLDTTIQANNVIIATPTNILANKLRERYNGIIPTDNIITHTALTDIFKNIGTRDNPIFKYIGTHNYEITKTLIIDEYQLIKDKKLDIIFQRAKGRLYLFGDLKQQIFSFYNNKELNNIPKLELKKTYRYTNSYLKMDIERLFRGETASQARYKNIKKLKSYYEKGYTVITATKFDVGVLHENGIQAVNLSKLRGEEYDKVICYYDGNNMKGKAQDFIYSCASRAKEDFVVFKGRFYPQQEYRGGYKNKPIISNRYYKEEIPVKLLNDTDNIYKIKVADNLAYIQIKREWIPIEGFWIRQLNNILAYLHYERTGSVYLQCDDISTISYWFNYCEVSNVVYVGDIIIGTQAIPPANHWAKFKQKRLKEYPIYQVPAYATIVRTTFRKADIEYDFDMKQAYINNSRGSPCGEIKPFDEEVLKVYKIINIDRLKLPFGIHLDKLNTIVFEKEAMYLESKGAVIEPYGSFASDNDAFHNYAKWLANTQHYTNGDINKQYTRKLFGQITGGANQLYKNYRNGRKTRELPNYCTLGYEPLAVYIKGNTTVDILAKAEELSKEIGEESILAINIDGIRISKLPSRAFYEKNKSKYKLSKR